MGRIIVAGVVGLLSFGLAAGGSIMMMKSAQKDAEEDKKDDEAVVEVQPGDGSQAPDQPQGQPKEPIEDLPIAVRATPASPEEIVRYGMTFKKREEALKGREEELRQERLRLKLVFEDVRAEQRELEGLEQQIRGKLLTAEDVLKKINEKQAEMTQQQEEAKEDLKKFDEKKSVVDAAEMENIKRMSKWFEAMQPETAADYLKELVNDGKMATAVEILSNFQEREASKILSAMNDPTLVVQLAEEFKSRRQTKK